MMPADGYVHSWYRLLVRSTCQCHRWSWRISDHAIEGRRAIAQSHQDSWSWILSESRVQAHSTYHWSGRPNTLAFRRELAYIFSRLPHQLGQNWSLGMHYVLTVAKELVDGTNRFGRVTHMAAIGFLKPPSNSPRVYVHCPRTIR